MTDQIKAIISEVERFNDSIRDTLTAKGINDTGEAARSLYVDYGNDFVRSVGIFYIEFLDTGRAPGKFPPKDPIGKWVQSKIGISDTDPEFDSIVFLIQRKIARLGTEIFRNNGKGLEIDKKIVTLRKALDDVVAESVISSINKRLDLFKKANLKNKYQI